MRYMHVHKATSMYAGMISSHFPFESLLLEGSLDIAEVQQVVCTRMHAYTWTQTHTCDCDCHTQIQTRRQIIDLYVEINKAQPVQVLQICMRGYYSLCMMAIYAPIKSLIKVYMSNIAQFRRVIRSTTHVQSLLRCYQEYHALTCTLAQLFYCHATRS